MRKQCRLQEAEKNRSAHDFKRLWDTLGKPNVFQIARKYNLFQDLLHMNLRLSLGGIGGTGGVFDLEGNSISFVNTGTEIILTVTDVEVSIFFFSR